MFDAKYDENDIEKNKKRIQIKRKISKIKNLYGDGKSSREFTIFLKNKYKSKYFKQKYYLLIKFLNIE